MNTTTRLPQDNANNDTSYWSTAWLMWLVAAIFYALDYFQHTAPSVLIQPIAQSLNANVTTIGNIMSIYFPIYAIAQLPAGYILDRYGLKFPLTVACLLVSIGLLAMQGSTVYMIILGRGLIAFGSAFAFLGALKTASTWLPKSVFPIAVGLTNTIGVLGGLVGQPFLNNLIEKYHWQQALFYIAIFGFMLSAIIFIFLHSPRNTQAQKTSPMIKKAILADKDVWLLALYAGIMVGTVVNALSELYDVVFLQQSFHIGSEPAAYISMMVFIGIAVGGPLHGIISRFFTYKRTWMLISCATTIVLFSLIIFSPVMHLNIRYAYPLFFLTGFFVSSMLLSFSLIKCCYISSMHALIFAVINMVISLCAALFQLVLGVAIHYFTSQPNITHPYFYSLLTLLAPLMASFIICYSVRIE